MTVHDEMTYGYLQLKEAPNGSEYHFEHEGGNYFILKEYDSKTTVTSYTVYKAIDQNDELYELETDFNDNPEEETQ